MSCDFLPLVIEAEVISRSEEQDCSLIRITVPNDVDWAVRPISISQSCEVPIDKKVYVMGYPLTFERKAPDMKPIDDQFTVRRRWSSGVVFTGVVAGKIVQGTTADAIQGNSGGPFLDDAGELVGLFVTMTSDTLGAYKLIEYNDKGQMKSRVFHSAMIRCDVIKSFLAPSLTIHSSRNAY